MIDGNLPGIIDEALATAEIRTALADQRLGLTENDLRTHALANRDRIADASRAEFDRMVDYHPRRWRRGPFWRRHKSPTVDATVLWNQWRTKTRDDGVLPLLRTLINEKLAPLQWFTMTVHGAPGLDRVRDHRFIVETSSAKRFLDLAGQIRFGAIGIAGARGVGKTTVIEYYQSVKPAPISLLVPAPVQYNAREFVLHLYAELCNAVLRHFAPLDKVGRMLYRRAAEDVAWGATIAVLAFVAGGLVVGPTRLPHYPSGLGITETVTGGALLLITVCALAFVILRFGRLAQLNPRLLRPLRWLVLGPEALRVNEDLVERARERLKRIRFLQTSTTGWSGKLAGPSSELSLTRSTQRAEQPLTYPEIVHELRRFIGMIVAAMDENPAVIVAVDELDKIQDAAQAQAFVNEIKGVFGVPGAQFLVSVSEDALASFERRGLPVRDAFDSAFDEIIRIEPLDLADACTLLRSRVIGVSDLFSGLAHCMAGGLARDIIRTARSMRAVATEAAGIEPVSVGLIEGDIQRKIHAFQQATGQLDGGPDTTDFIRDLRTLRADPRALRDTAPELLPTVTDQADFRQVRWQAATYAYHCATILEVFTEALTTDRFSRDRETLQTLATAKQELGTHPQLAWLMVDEFRIAWGLLPFQRRERELA
jgi:hypothetical protein